MKSGLGVLRQDSWHTDHLSKVVLLANSIQYNWQLLYVAALSIWYSCFQECKCTIRKCYLFQTCTADIFITWKKRDANKTTWPFGHSQISSERAAEHFREFYRFKFQKTNGSSMYWIHVSYWGHIRKKLIFIHPAYPARYCIPSFLGLGSPNTAFTWHP